MRICIVECDRPSPELQPSFGSYADMLENWLSRALPEAQPTRVFIDGGEPLPSMREVDGVLLSGSRHSVYDDLEWIGHLKVFLNKLRDARKPVAGICFGHQIMAEAYGGKVEKSDRGWNVGRHLHNATPEGESQFAGKSQIAALSFHQDQVVRLPKGGRILLSSRDSPYGGLAYDFPALSVQFHPEFSSSYVRALLQRWAGTRVPAELAEAALPTLTQALDADVIAASFADFFRSHHI